MIGGTSGSETKLCQPAASQSNRTQTRLSSFGSRKTVAPFDPCCRRLSAPFVEKIFSKRSKSSTCVVARIIAASLQSPAPGVDADVCSELAPSRLGRHRPNYLCRNGRTDEVVLEGPECGGGSSS